MKRTLILVLFALMMTAPGGLAHEEDTGIAGIMKDFEQAWNLKDSQAMASLCNERGSYVDWTGNLIHWAREPESMFSGLFQRTWKDTRLTLGSTRTDGFYSSTGSSGAPAMQLHAGTFEISGPTPGV